MKSICAIAAVLALGACSTPAASTNAGAAIVSGYVLAVNGALALAQAKPALAPAIKACDAVAWVAVQPISMAMSAGKDPTATEVAAANTALTAMQPCLDAAGFPAGATK